MPTGSRPRKMISLYLLPEEYERYQAAAAAEGITFNDMVRGLLNRYVTPRVGPPLHGRMLLLEERVRAMEAALGITPEEPPPPNPDFGVTDPLPQSRRARPARGRQAGDASPK